MRDEISDGQLCRRDGLRQVGLLCSQEGLRQVRLRAMTDRFAIRKDYRQVGPRCSQEGLASRQIVKVNDSRSSRSTHRPVGLRLGRTALQLLLSDLPIGPPDPQGSFLPKAHLTTKSSVVTYSYHPYLTSQNTVRLRPGK
jgi:hypothetical protein